MKRGKFIKVLLTVGLAVQGPSLVASSGVVHATEVGVSDSSGLQAADSGASAGASPDGAGGTSSEVDSSGDTEEEYNPPVLSESDPNPLDEVDTKSALAIADGYVIETVADLDQIAAHPDGQFSIVTDLDVTGYTGLTGVNFTGVINGNGYTLRGVNAGSPLFASMTNAQVTDWVVEVDSAPNGVAPRLATLADHTTLRNVVLKSAVPDLKIGAWGATQDSQSGFLFDVIRDSSLDQVKVDIPSVEYSEGFMSAGFISRQMIDTQVTNLDLGAVKLRGTGSNYIFGIVTNTLDGGTFENVKGSLEASGFGYLQRGGILASEYAGTVGVKSSTFEMTVTDIPRVQTMGVLIGGATNSVHGGNQSVLNIEDSHITWSILTPDVEMLSVSGTTGAAYNSIVNIKNSTINATIPNANTIQSVSGGALSAGVVGSSSITTNFTTKYYKYSAGGFHTISDSKNNIYTIDIKVEGGLNNSGGVSYIGGSFSHDSADVNMQLDSNSSSGAMLFAYGVASNAANLDNSVYKIRIMGRPVAGSSSSAAGYIVGLVGSAVNGNPAPMLTNIEADVVIDLDYGSLNGYTGVNAFANETGDIVNSKLTGKMKLHASNDYSFGYAVATTGQIKDSTIDYSLDASSEGDVGYMAPFSTVTGVDNSIFTLNQTIHAKQTSTNSGLAFNWGNSKDSTYNINLELIADTLANNNHMLGSGLGGELVDNTFNLQFNSKSNTVENVYVVNTLSPSRMQNNVFNITGEITGVFAPAYVYPGYDQETGYSFVSVLPSDSEIDNLAIHRNLVLSNPETQAVKGSELFRHTHNGSFDPDGPRSIRGLAYVSEQAPEGFNSTVNKDDAEVEKNAFNYENSYFIFPTKSDYDFKNPGSLIHFKDGYVRYLDEPDAMVWDQSDVKAVKALTMGDYPAFDSALWQKQATDGVDSPRLSWLLEKEPSIKPAGASKDGKVSLSWAGDGVSTYVAWEDGDADSVLSAAGAENATFMLPVGPSKVRTYRVARVTPWGVKVPTEGYVYDPAAVVVPVDPTPTQPTDPVDPKPVDPKPVDPTPTPTPTPSPDPVPNVPVPSDDPTPKPEPIIPVKQPDVLPTPTPEKPQEQPVAPIYPDVQPGAYYEPAVRALTASGVIKGVPAGGFLPDREITRVEFALMLKRAMGYASEEGYKGGFFDLEPSSWYMPELTVALNTGVTKGFTDHKYRPNLHIPREQAAIMLANILRQTGFEPELKSLEYADGSSIIAWALNDVNKVVAAGILQGFPDQTIRPKAHLTRGDAAVLIYRLMQMVEK